MARHALRMPRMEALFNTVVPVALVVLSGYLLGRRLEMDLSTLSRLTLYALVPALILDSMYRAEYTLEGVWGLVLGFSLTYALLFLLVQGRGSSLASPGKPPRPSSSAASSPTPATWASPWSTSPSGRRA